MNLSQPNCDQWKRVYFQYKRTSAVQTEKHIRHCWTASSTLSDQLMESTRCNNKQQWILVLQNAASHDLLITSDHKINAHLKNFCASSHRNQCPGLRTSTSRLDDLLLCEASLSFLSGRACSTWSLWSGKVKTVGEKCASQQSDLDATAFPGISWLFSTFPNTTIGYVPRLVGNGGKKQAWRTHLRT